jgi:dipeptidyl aminopeptidase/acylaminoacyl peptidase
MRADGRAQTQLTTSPAFDGDPAYSPDGGRIAFTSARDGNREIYVMNADGSSQTRLTHTAGRVGNPDHESVDQNPAWSPDGRRIYFDSSRDGNLNVYVMNADGSGQTRLTDSPALDAIPIPSPDGRTVLFTSDRLDRDRRELFTMTVNGRGVRHVGRGTQGDWQRLGPRPAGCTLWGTIGDDLIPGTAGRDVVCGGIGNDTLLGLGGADSLVGGFDDDVLDGGSGADRLRGDYGNDVFRTRDEARDLVEGGLGRDRAIADRRDRLSSIERRG